MVEMPDFIFDTKDRDLINNWTKLMNYLQGNFDETERRLMALEARPKQGIAKEYIEELEEEIKMNKELLREARDGLIRLDEENEKLKEENRKLAFYSFKNDVAEGKEVIEILDEAIYVMIAYIEDLVGSYGPEFTVKNYSEDGYDRVITIEVTTEKMSFYAATAFAMIEQKLTFLDEVKEDEFEISKRRYLFNLDKLKAFLFDNRESLERYM